MRLRLLALLLAAAPSTAFAAPIDPAPGIIAEMNRARADPARYADELDRFRGQYDGRIVREAGEPLDRVTTEGVKAVNDAIAFLRRQPPVGPLASAPALALAAADHVRDQGSGGWQGHVARDGSTPLDRVLRRGLRPFAVGEVIAYGPRSAAAVVRELIIDDGVADRGHRLAIFNPAFGRAGAACGPHRRYGLMCVVDMASTVDAPAAARRIR